MGFRMGKAFLTSGDLSKVKVQGQIKKTSNSNISKTIRDREKMSIEVV